MILITYLFFVLGGAIGFCCCSVPGFGGVYYCMVM